VIFEKTSYWVITLKQKITVNAVIFEKTSYWVLCRFCQSFDTLGAQYLFDLATVFKNSCFLQVGFEFTVGRLHGEGATVTESRFFTAVCTFSHLGDPL